MKLYLFWIFIVISAFPLQAQISMRVNELLPDSLRPANREKITISEAQNILQRAFDIKEFGRSEFDVIDNLCYQFAPRYSTIRDNRERLDFLFFICNYLYHSYALHTENKSIIKGDSGKYKSPHTELGLKYCDLYLKEYEKHPVQNINWMLNVLMTKGHFQIESDLYREAFYTFQEQITTGRNHQSVYSESLGYNGLSFLFDMLSLPRQALAYADSGLLALAQIPADDQWAENQRINFLQARQKLLLDKMTMTGNNQLTDSIQMIHTEIKERRNENSARFEASSHVILASISYTKKAFGEAIAHVDSAFSIYPDLPGLATGEQAIALKGISLLNTGKDVDGISVLQSLHFKASIGNIVRTALEELYRYELSKNNLKKALEYSNQILQFNNRKHELEIQGKSLEMEQFYNVKAREHQISQLKQLKARNEFIAFVIFFVVILVLGVVISRYKVAQAKTNNLLKKVDEAMEMQVVQVEEARDKERKLIGQQLHDDLSSSMAATLGYLRMLPDIQGNPQIIDKSFRISNLLEESYNKARSKSHELYLEEDSANFWKRLTEQVDFLLSGTRIILDFQRDIEGIILSSEIKTAIILILKEAITNIVKHSKATRTEILLYSDQGQLILVVNDNGSGFRTHQMGKSAGYKSIVERVNKLDGVVKLVSHEKTGTSVNIRFPLQTAYR